MASIRSNFFARKDGPDLVRKTKKTFFTVLGKKRTVETTYHVGNNFSRLLTHIQKFMFSADWQRTGQLFRKIPATSLPFVTNEKFLFTN